MAKHFSDPTFQAEVPQQRKRGRPPEVDPEKLRRNVIELSFALEENWGEVGGPLRGAESIVDIRTALRKIMNPQCRLLEPFTCDQIQEPDTIRNATPAKFAEQLRELRDKLSDSMQRNRKTFETRQVAYDGCENAFHSWVAESDPVKQAQIQTIRPSLARDYEEAEALEEASRLERDSLQAELKEREAYFSQCEILRFIQGKRYEFTPMNVARAMGGLPFVTARVSFMQCAKHGIDPRPGMPFQIFQIIEDLVRRPIDDLANSIHSIREYLLKPRRDPPAPVAELRRNWYFLESAIRFVARDRGAPMDSLPYRLFAEYTRTLASQSAADSVLASANKLVVPGDYAAPKSGPDWGPKRKNRRN